LVKEYSLNKKENAKRRILEHQKEGTTETVDR
jgi:hypothetical protein